MLSTAKDILTNRGKFENPKGERLGVVAERLRNHLYVDVVAAKLPSGRLVLDRYSEKIVGRIFLSEKIGRRVIDPADDTVVFR